MLPFESLAFNGSRAAPRPVRCPPLPLFVQPISEETLLSWLFRLAARLEVPLHTLARESFGVDDRSGHTQWWCHPHPWVLARIGHRTGVCISRLREMTFEMFEPSYRDDETSARFAGRRYDNRAPDQRTYRIAICGPCLQADKAAFLRSTWLIGWMAVCPHHNVRLITRCKRCRRGLGVPPFSTAAAFAPTVCLRCGESLLDGCYEIAHPSVIQLQAALLRAKREGVTDLFGFGQFSWKELVALADVLLGTVWTGTTFDERQRIWSRYEFESVHEPRGEMQIHDCRHDSLRFLAWLLEGWPDSMGAEIGRTMLRRGLSSKRNRLSHHLLPRWHGHPWSPGPHDIGPDIQLRLRELPQTATNSV